MGYFDETVEKRTALLNSPEILSGAIGQVMCVYYTQNTETIKTVKFFSVEETDLYTIGRVKHIQMSRVDRGAGSGVENIGIINFESGDNVFYRVPELNKEEASR